MFDYEDRRDWLRYSTVGLEFAFTFILGLGLGVWLDEVHGPPPAYTLTFGAVGFLVALYRLLRQAFEIKRKEEIKAKIKAKLEAKAKADTEAQDDSNEPGEKQC